jgi:hypothetical protein
MDALDWKNTDTKQQQAAAKYEPSYSIGVISPQYLRRNSKGIRTKDTYSSRHDKKISTKQHSNDLNSQYSYATESAIEKKNYARRSWNYKIT